MSSFSPVEFIDSYVTSLELAKVLLKSRTYQPLNETLMYVHEEAPEVMFLSHQKIAALIGASREAVTRTMRGMGRKRERGRRKSDDASETW